MNLVAADKIHHGQNLLLCVSVASGNEFVCTQWWEKYSEALSKE